MIAQSNEMLYYYTWLTSDGRFVWYINFNGLLMQIEIETGELQCLGLIPSKNEDKTYRYLRIAYVQDRLILIPNLENNVICEYDFVRKEFILYDIPEEVKKISKENGCRFLAVCQYNGILYMYGYYPVVVGYDVDKHIFKMYEIDTEKVNCIKEQYFFHRASTIIGHNLLIPTNQFHKIVQIDLLEDTIEYISITNSNHVLNGEIVTIGEKVFVVIVTAEGELQITEYNKEMYCCSTKSYQLPQTNNLNSYFGWIGAVDGKIILLAGEQDLSYVIDVNEHSMEMILVSSLSVNRNYENNRVYENYIHAQILSEKEIITINKKSKELILLDVEDISVIRKEIRVTNQLCNKLKKVAEMVLMETGMILESEGYINVEDFVRIRGNNAVKKSSQGKNIWKEIRK